MPTVPTYDGPQLRTQALRPVYQDTPDVSSGLVAAGRALSNVGEAIDQRMQRDAELKANETDTLLTTDFNKWEDENRGKYTNQNAEGYRSAVETWWKESAAKYGEKLDPRARQIVNQTLLRRKAIALDQAGKYETVEKEKYFDSTVDAAMTTATVNALKTGDYAGEAQRIRDLTAQQGVRKNWDKDQRDSALNARLGVFNVAVITQMAEKDAAAAQAYLAAAIERKEIRPEQQTKLEGIVKGEADNQFARAKGVELLGMTPERRKEEFAKITDPQRLEKTQIAFKTQLGLEREAQQVAQQSAADDAWTNYVDKGRTVPERLRLAMGETNLRELMNFERTRAERLSKGASVKTDMVTYIDVREKLARGDKVDLRGYTEKIAPAQMEQLLDIQAAASKPGSAKQDSMLTDEQRMLRGAPKGINPKDNPDAYGLYVTEVDRRVRAASLAKGDKQLTPDEKQKIVDSVATDQVFVDEWGRDPKKPLVLLNPEELKKAYVTVDGKSVPLTTVPMADRAEIIRKRLARGLPTTEQSIVETYMKANPKAAPQESSSRFDEVAAAAKGRVPSPYASPEAWAAYRSWQSTNK